MDEERTEAIRRLLMRTTIEDLADVAWSLRALGVTDDEIGAALTSPVARFGGHLAALARR